MSKTNANTKSQLGAEEWERPLRGCAGPEMKGAMAEMLAYRCCGSEMMVKMAGLMGGGAPSKPAEPTQKTP